MKNGIRILFTALYFSGILFAGQSKIIKKSFNVESNKTVEFRDFTGLKVKIKSWDKNEIGFNLKAYVDCSDEEYESLYIKSLDIESSVFGTYQTISLVKTNEKGGGFSFFGLFDIKIGYHFRNEIKGEIFLPKKLMMNLEITYSDVSMTDIHGIGEIQGKGNDLQLFNCSGLTNIDNDYGNIRLEKCAGDIDINSKSTNIEINDHVGNLKIESDYTKIRIDDVKGVIGVSDKSGDIEIKNATVKYLDIPYSDLEIRDMNEKTKGSIIIKGKSSTLSFYNVKSDMEISSDYTNVKFRNTTGNITYQGKSCDIRGEQFEGDIDFDVSYTDIDFSTLRAGDIKITDSNNSIYLVMVTEPKNVDIEDKYGRVELSIPGSYDGEINLRTRYGNIKSDFDLNYNKESSETTAYSKGKNSGKKIRIETLSTDIYLRK